VTTELLAKLLVLSLFALTYLFIVIFYHHKMIVVWVGVALLMALRLIGLGPMGFRDAAGAVEWNVILLYFGMLLVSEVFLYSRMPDYLATVLTRGANRVGGAMVLLCLFSGFLSIALENVAVVLLIAPVALAIARKCDVPPVPLFVGIAISSNLQGAATLIGDPPSMLLAGFARLGFNDFFIYQGRPGIFFATQVGAVVSAVVLMVIFRRYNREMPTIPREPYLSAVPTYLVAGLIAALVASSSFSHSFGYMTGTLCAVFGLACLLWYVTHSRGRELSTFFKSLDWQTGVFLVGIFVLVESLSAVGVMDDLAELVLKASGSRPFVAYLLIVWLSVLVSGFVDNVPFLVAMLPVMQIVTTRLGVTPYLFYVGLLLGASVGGNITPVGASANIVAMGIMRKQGYRAGFWDFVRIGLPFTVFSVVAASMFAWLVFRALP
jgi:Na+/H+ antiporter NhaD/arsenite permease-like protein